MTILLNCFRVGVWPSSATATVLNQVAGNSPTSGEIAHCCARGALHLTRIFDMMTDCWLRSESSVRGAMFIAAPNGACPFRAGENTCKVQQGRAHPATSFLKRPGRGGRWYRSVGILAFC